VFAGSEGFWKYEVGNEELDIPRRELLGADVLGLAWSCLRCVSIDLVAYETEAFARGFASLVVYRTRPLCSRNAVRTAIFVAMVSGKSFMIKL
jgi:hypothetical protein